MRAATQYGRSGKEPNGNNGHAYCLLTFIAHLLLCCEDTDFVCSAWRSQQNGLQMNSEYNNIRHGWRNRWKFFIQYPRNWHELFFGYQLICPENFHTAKHTLTFWKFLYEPTALFVLSLLVFLITSTQVNQRQVCSTKVCTIVTECILYKSR